MSTIPTVKVKAPDGGYMLINECDLEGSNYVRLEEKAGTQKAEPKKATTKKKVAAK